MPRTLDYAPSEPQPRGGCFSALVPLALIILILGGAPVAAAGLLFLAMAVVSASPVELIFGGVLTSVGGGALLLASVLDRRLPPAKSARREGENE